jgi:hypothetical protein
MTRYGFGWGLIVLGIAVQVAESMAQSTATLNNTQFSASTIGKVVAPIEKYLPIQAGYSLIVAGAGVLWLLPLVS